MLRDWFPVNAWFPGDRCLSLQHRISAKHLSPSSSQWACCLESVWALTALLSLTIRTLHPKVSGDLPTACYSLRVPHCTSSADCVCTQSLQSCPTLCNPMNCSPPSPQAPLSVGFSRQEYWTGLLCPLFRGSSDPRMEPVPPASPVLSQADSLPLSHSGKPHFLCYSYINSVSGHSSSFQFTSLFRWIEQVAWAGERHWVPQAYPGGGNQQPLHCSLDTPIAPCSLSHKTWTRLKEPATSDTGPADAPSPQGGPDPHTEEQGDTRQ